jgi:hypothetical protein
MGTLSRCVKGISRRLHIMRQALEATLILTISAVLTLLIMAVVFPRHVLGGAASMNPSADIQPAVFVFGVHDEPGTAVSPTVPGTIHRSRGAGCPYLAALAAASGCPAFSGDDVRSACPYLERQHEPEPTTEEPVNPRALDI